MTGIMQTNSVNVLLVDANSADAEELCRKLAESKNTTFIVESVRNCSRGLELASGKKFDVVLIDLSCTKGGWQQHFEELRSRSSELPIVVISSLYQETLALEVVRAGAEDYLVKSRLNSAALERILLYCVERRRSRRRAALQYSVTRVLAESETLSEAEQGILRAVCELLEFDCGQFWHFDHWSSELVCARCWTAPSCDFPHFISKTREMRYEKGFGLAGRAWGSSAPVWVSEVSRDEGLPCRAAAAQDGIQSGCAFPISLHGDLLGIMQFVCTDVREPDDELLKIVASIGNQIGQFIARKLAEEEKERVTNERLLILDSVSEGVFGVDLHGKITFVNRSAAKMLGCVPADALGKIGHELFHHSLPDGSPYPREKCPIATSLAAGQNRTIHGEHFWKLDGSHFEVEYSAVPVFAHKELTGGVICFTDVTQRKQMEVELRHAQKLEAVGGLAAGIAHEINTPIQFVSDNTRFLQDAVKERIRLWTKYEELCEAVKKGNANAEMLEEIKALKEQIDWEYLEKEIPKALEQMQEGLGRVAKIVRAMKEFSHVDQSAEKAAADLNKAMESTLIVARNELKYVADVDAEYGELSPVVCHLGDLNQVFLNLLVNAAHAIADVVKGTGEKGRIGVRTRQDGDWVEIAISDTGTGIPKAVRDKVFDPFFTTKEVGKGTGQGLALARAVVVEKHGGTLTFDTTVGKGTTFYVRLPVAGSRDLREAVAK